MKRRAFITLLGGEAAPWPLVAQAQEPARMKRIRLMANRPLRPIEAFRKKLQELGYVEGKSLIIEFRFAEGRDERYPAFAAELVALPVDLIAVWGTPAAFAAKRATTTIPIVIGAAGDVVNTGLVSNLARPDGNITGFIALSVELEEKRLELLKDVVPRLSRVAVLGNSLNPLSRLNLDAARRAAQRLSVAIEEFEVQSGRDVERALRAGEYDLRGAREFVDGADGFSVVDSTRQARPAQTRAASLYGVIVHGNELAGTAYVYLRSKNIVPPSTENAQRGRQGRGN